VGETLEAAFGEDGDSEEEDAIVNQVLDEIGISMNEKVCFFRFYFISFCKNLFIQIAIAPRVPAAASGMTANRGQRNDEDAEIERMLANLKS
jgi:hypothetical protein